MGVVTGGGGGGGAAFNGGTITNPLVIDHAAAAAALLSVLGTDAGAAGRAGVVSDHGGQFTVNATSGAGLRVVAAIDSVDSYTLIDAAETGVTVNLSDAYFAQFQIRSRGDSGRRLLDCGRFDSGEIIVGFFGGKVGFYGYNGVDQQIVDSGSVTPAQLAVALQTSGLLGGT
jgi:hypothetical protein